MSAVEFSASRTERLALRVFQLAAVAIVLIVSTRTLFELDRFFIPKELVLHVAAVLVALLAARKAAGSLTRLDLYLAGFWLLSAVSALFATNRWLAMRAVAISASGLLLFWAGRRLREVGLGRPLLHALAFGVVLIAITSLLQTYGVETLLFSENRAPGGTLGNRNFVAHAAAFGLPLILLNALTARRRMSFVLAAGGVMITTASLVLTRSRAAWLAFAAVALVLVASMLLSPPLRRDGRTWLRLLAIAALGVAGGAAAILIPNTLRWRSDNPYLESMQRVADYQGGSGRGRLVQYGQSLKMAARHPLFGVGPGNWAVAYPAHAARHDPSMNDGEPGMTFNPWPSSDWIAWISERGVTTVVLMALAFLGLALGGLRQLSAARDVEEGMLAMALLGMVAGASITGAFDAVLLLALPAFLIWTALGALWIPPAPDRLASNLGRAALLVLLLASLVGAMRSAAQWTAMEIQATRGDRASLVRAASIDPGSYRLQLRLARMGGRGRCEHAQAAHGLYPHAAAAAAAARGCR